jgi:hypothetical protein
MKWMNESNIHDRKPFSIYRRWFFVLQGIHGLTESYNLLDGMWIENQGQPING